jgi:hypothetical protein
MVGVRDVESLDGGVGARRIRPERGPYKGGCDDHIDMEARVNGAREAAPG